MTGSGLGGHKHGENSKDFYASSPTSLPPPPTKSGFTPLLLSALEGSPLPTSCLHQPTMLSSWTSRMGFGGLLGQGGAYLTVVTLHVVVSVHGHDSDGLI